MVIHIARSDGEKVRQLAYQIAIEYKQLGVGIAECINNEGPIYGRIEPVQNIRR
jgi:hypothetical protein